VTSVFSRAKSSAKHASEILPPTTFLQIFMNYTKHHFAP
jgi:hypothetical protein